MLLQLLPVNVLGYRAVDLSEAEASPVENTLADSGEDLEYQDSAYQGETEASNHAVRSIAELCELDGVTMDADGGVASICGDQLACITSEELELLQEFSANDEQLLSAEQVANMTLNKYDVSPDQLREAENAYEHQSEYLSELATLTGFEQFREVSAASRAEIVDMISAGISANDAVALNVALHCFGLDKESVVAEYLEARDSEDVEQVQSFECSLFSKRTALPASTAQSVIDEYDGTFEELLAAYRQEKDSTYPYKDSDEDAESTLQQGYMLSEEDMVLEGAEAENDIDFSEASSASELTSTSTSQDDIAPNRFLDEPYSHYKNGNLDVNLNTGAYTFSDTDLSLPGLNGLDLNFTRIYSSEMGMSETLYGSNLNSSSTRYAVNVGFDLYQIVSGDEDNPVKIASSDYRLAVSEADEIAQGTKFRYNGTGYIAAPNGNTYPNTITGAILYYNDLCNVGDEDHSPYIKTYYAAYDRSDGDRLSGWVAVVPRMTPVNTSYLENNVQPYDYMVNEYGLGHGWRLGFSSIEAYDVSSVDSDGYILPDSAYRLIRSDGSILNIAKSGNRFENYPLDDISISHSGSGYQGAEWTVSYRDGRKEYFNGSGRIIAIVNRFGNTIRFEYTLSGSQVTQIKITDTVGRVITFKDELMDPTETAQIRVQSRRTNYNVKWTLWLDDELVRTYYSYYDTENTNQPRCLMGVSNEKGEFIRLTTQICSKRFNVYLPQSDTDSDGVYYTTELKEVRYPDGSSYEIEHFSQFSNPKRSAYEKLGLSGFMATNELYEVNQQYLYDNVIYSIEMQYNIGDTYHYRPYTSEAQDKNAEYVTTVNKYHNYPNPEEEEDFRTTGVPHTQQKYYFQADSLKKCEELYVRSEVQYEEINTASERDAVIAPCSPKLFTTTDYSYNESQLPTNVTVTQKNDPFGTNPNKSRTKTYTYTYNDYGEVLTSTAPNGQQTTYTYDSTYGLSLTKSYNQDASTAIVESRTLTADKKNVAEETITSNGTITQKTAYTYNTNGTIASVRAYKDAAAYEETLYAYSNTAQPTVIQTSGVRDSSGALVVGSPGFDDGVLAVKVAYDNRGRVVSQTDQRGNTQSYVYNEVGQVTRVTAPDGGQQQYAYQYTYTKNSVNTVQFTDELERVLEYRYDQQGNLREIYDVTNSVLLEKDEYDQLNNLMRKTICSSTQDPVTYYYHYDRQDRLVEMGIRNSSTDRTPLETYEYFDGQGKVIHTKKGENGAPDVVTTEYYDIMDNVIKTSVTIGGTEKITTYTLDYLGNQVQEKTAFTTDRGGSYTNQYTYDPQGHVLTQANADGDTASFTYDLQGRQTSATDFQGSTSYYTYDAASRLVEERHPFQQGSSSTVYAKTLYDYDQSGNMISKRQSDNLPGGTESYSRTDYAYDSMDRLVQTTSFDNGTAACYTQYYYDKAGNLLRQYTGQTSPLIISGLDQVSGSSSYAVTRYTYNTFGQQSGMTDALGNSETYTYDCNGRMLTKTDRNGTVTTYTYDTPGNLLTTTAGSGVQQVTISNTYYANGALKTASSGGVTTTYTYNDQGLVAQEAESGGITREYTYDAAGNRLSMTVKNGSTVQLALTYTYDNQGRLYQVKDNGTVIAVYTYDANGNRSSLTYANGVTTTYGYNLANLVTSLENKKGSTVLSSYAYTYQLDGNQRTKTDSTGLVTSYTYDGLGRLTGEAESTGQSLTYAYNSFGNRSSLTASGTQSYVTTYSYDLNNRLLTESKVQGGQTAVTTYTYDANGNALSASGGGVSKSYTYDALNRQVSATNDGTTAQYTYDAGGLRRSKTVGGTTTTQVWDGSELVLELTGGTVTGKYLRGLGLIAADIGGARSYYLYNAHGDVTGLTNTAGTVTKVYAYDAFGNEKAPSDTDVNPIRYCGQYYDKETGSYYLRARYYNPIIGRFISEDPARHDTNWYLYCYSNPVRYVDPNGKVPVETILDAVSAVGSAADFLDDPSWITAGYLLWDIGALLLPYVPGSYTTKGVSIISKADDAIDIVNALNKADNIADAAKIFKQNSKSFVGSYRDIKKTVKSLGVKNMEVHHLIEKRFAKTLGLNNTNDMLSVALDKDTHRDITKRFRDEIGYIYDFSNERRTNTVDPNQIWAAAVKVYTDKNMTQYLPDLKEQLLASASNVDLITDWKGW